MAALKEECYCKCNTGHLKERRIPPSVRPKVDGDVVLAGLTHWVFEHLGRLTSPERVAVSLLQRLSDETRSAMYHELIQSFDGGTAFLTDYDANYKADGYPYVEPPCPHDTPSAVERRMEPDDAIGEAMGERHAHNTSDTSDDIGDVADSEPPTSPPPERHVMEDDPRPHASPPPAQSTAESAALALAARPRAAAPAYYAPNPFAESTTTIDALPPEVLIMIFAYVGPRRLDNVAKTCLAWRALTLDVAMWSGQVVHPKTVHQTHQVVAQLRAWPVRHLKLTSQGHTAPEAARLYAAAVPHLRKLELRPRGARCSDESLNAFLASCPDLSELQLSRCVGVTLSGLRGHATLPALTTLCITNCPDVAARAVADIVRSCPNLTSLSIPHFKLESDDMLMICRSLPKLSTLNVLAQRLVDSSLEQLAMHTPLVSLALYQAEHFTDRALKTVASKCPKLRLLHISSCRAVTEHGLASLLEMCSHIEELELTHCDAVTDNVLGMLGDLLPNLRELAVPGCSAITDAGVRCLGVNRCPRLVALHIGGCAHISDQSLSFLNQNCPRLQQLFVGRCGQITDEAFFELREPMPQLTNLKASHLPLLTAHGLEGLRVCPNIRGITLDECRLIDDAALMVICKLAPRLEKLHVVNCSRITDAGAWAIETAFPRLRDFNLQGCSGIRNFKLGMRRPPLMDRDYEPYLPMPAVGVVERL